MYLTDGMDEKESIKKVAKDLGKPKSEIIYKEYHTGKW